MKTSIKIFTILVIGLLNFLSVSAQNKKAVLAAAINDKNFVFVADYVEPARGAGHGLTSEYTVTVAKDSLMTYLPYFGQATMANINGDKGGIQLTATKFDYTQTTAKRGNVEILITPLGQPSSDALAVKSLRFNISPDGWATLQIMNYNRDPIIFNGRVHERNGKGI
jgi:hypothetical protein